MKRYLFLMYHGKGHFNAVFELASVLRRHGDQPIIAGFEFFRGHVVSQELEFYGLKTLPFALEFEPWVNQMQRKKFIWWHALRDRWANRLFRERRDELMKLIEDTRPDVIMVDSWQSTDVIVLYPLAVGRGIRIAMIQTMCSTAVVDGIPPLNSSAVPDNVRDTRKALKNYKLAIFKKNIRQFVRYAGMSNKSLMRRIMNVTGMTQKGYKLAPAVFAPAIHGIDEFILADPDFDFASRQNNPFRKYLGFLPWLDRTEQIDETFEKAFASILRQKTELKTPLIYFSLGTVLTLSPEYIGRFVDKLTSAITKLGWLCIIAGPNATITTPGDSRIFHFKQVPQIRVLKETAVFITTGGLNSIKEAISLEVPMIVIPMEADADTQGNASRVTVSGIGIHLDMRDVDDATLANQLVAVSQDPEYKNNLQQLKLRAAKTEREVISQLESISELK
jgi:zeaxanthin glucosyltransferase